MSENSQIIYTRSDLKGLKEKKEREIHEQHVAHLVNQIRNSILNTASSNNITTTLFIPYKLTYEKPIVIEMGVRPDTPTEQYEKKYKILIDTINKLKEQFIDVSIEYKTQKDLRTGQDINQGIYIDWS